MRFKIGSTYTLGYGIGKVKIEKPTAKGKTFKAVRQSDGKSLHFGDASMPTRQDNPKAKKNYCSRASGLAPRGFNPNTFSLIYWDCIPAKGTSTNSEDGMNKIRLYTNISKTQMSETDTHYKIKGIPITADNAVMNGILYSADENAKGMPSMIGQPLTLAHPESQGFNISAKNGVGMQDFYSGGNITDVYNSDGIWYADADIKKSMLAAQNDGQSYIEALNARENIGVSTGLTFSNNELSGTNSKGESYDKTAVNQDYDHLALLLNEAPAGGETTVMRFNGNETEVFDVDMVINSAGDVVNDEAGLFTKFKKWLANHGDFDSQEESGYNNQDLNTNEDRIMRDKMIAALNAANIEVNNLDDDALFAAYNEYMSGKKKDADADKDEDDKKKEKKDKAMNAEEISAIVAETVNAAVKPLKDELAANKEGELKGLREAVNALDLGLPEVAVNAMGKEDLESLVNKHGGSFADYSGLNVNHRANGGVKTETLDIDLNAGAED